LQQLDTSNFQQFVALFFAAAGMTPAEAIALNQQLLARVRAAPDELDIVKGLMEDDEALSQRILAEPSLEGNVHVFAVNSQVMVEVLEKATRVFRAATQAADTALA
jgi:hypothetical protein